MNILMVTNTYLPHVGGVARSVAAFTEAYRRRGHRVLVLAPTFEGMDESEVDVVRVPAIQNFNGSDFSVQLPIPPIVFPQLQEFEPDIVHSHHPFLLGSAAIRIAALHNVPLVFTHHTMYERYTHYVPGNSHELKRFVIELSTGYANLSQLVFAPSESLSHALMARGVSTPIEVVPTGVDCAFFASGDGGRFRRELDIPEDSFVVGHLGRLAPEKNLIFLARAAKKFLRRSPSAYLLVVGTGPSQVELEHLFAEMRERVRFAGPRTGKELADSFRAMDVFIFASRTETQGMVLTEAMAAGVPVVALDATGAREVVCDGENGRLLRRESSEEFARALTWVARRAPGERTRIQQCALATAEKFSMEACADRALEGYERARRSHAAPKPIEDSLWLRSMRLVETEWNLTTNTAEAMSRAILHSRLLSLLPVRILRRFARRVSRALDRSEWAIRALKLKTYDDDARRPGLVIVQIDGLSRPQLEFAIGKGRLRFLSRLLRRERYSLETLYSGLPSTTPAVQAELFYGVRSAVPAFQYFDRTAGMGRVMFDPTSAAAIEERLMQEGGEGLLNGGSCYSTIYSGGAAEPHFCAATFGWGGFLQAANPVTLFLLFLWHGRSVLRCVALLGIELVLAVIDCVRGIIEGERLPQELKFVFSRVSICILLRELVAAGAILDAVRGVPVIYLNLLGFDEQAHRRGPDSAFAHWTLRGIDRTIERIWRALSCSTRRNYALWVLSDHGQERVRSFALRHGQTLESVVRSYFDGESRDTSGRYRSSAELRRAAWLGGRYFRRLSEPPREPSADLEVAAMGPLGHVYLRSDERLAQRESLAEWLVREWEIPFVLIPGETVAIVSKGGCAPFVEQAAQVLGRDHPFLSEVTADLETLARHPQSGDLVCCGWSPEGRPLSFPVENGAHAGPGSAETHAFVLLPQAHRDSRPGGLAAEPIRPANLRELALRVLERGEERLTRRKRPRRILRLMTYNVHSCVGLDGKLSPLRVARVIANYDPDVVALQELDVRRSRTGNQDQAHLIAKELEMDFHFHPALAIEEELYGDAILSTLPLRLVRAGALPGILGRPLEPRGALFVTVEVDGCPVHVLNTHLGLLRQERAHQSRALLGPDWLGSTDGPVIVCGDLNDIPRSWTYQQFAAVLNDVQTQATSRRPKNTWSARIPFRRIDHIFINDRLRVKNVEVPKTELTSVASDHLPVIVELEVL